MLSWLTSPAQVSRRVNNLYFLLVLVITASVLGIALYTRNRRAVRMFLLAMVIWPLIELIGLVTGMRGYQPAQQRIAIFLFVALVEDPGWVCLGYMIGEALFRRVYGPAGGIGAPRSGFWD